MAGDPSGGSNTLQSPFIFVRRGDPDPVEWMQAHPGWVKFPAVMVPRGSAPELAEARTMEIAEAGEAAPAGEDSHSYAQSLAQRDRIRHTQAKPAPPGFGPQTQAGAPVGHRAAGRRRGGLRRAKEGHVPSLGEPTNLEAARERAFLHLLRWEETGDVPEDVAYHARYGYLDPMTDAEMKNYVPKPETVKSRHGGSTTSSAAGAYQITKATWSDAQRILGVHDFTPQVQDYIAAYLVATTGAEEFVRNGDLKQAFRALGGRFSSLPGSTQSHHSEPEAQSQFDRYLMEELAK